MFVLSALFVFYCIGFLLPFSDEDGGTSASETICGGLLITVSVFELSSVLCVLAGVKLMTCLYIGGGAVIVLFVTSVVLHIGDYGHRVRCGQGTIAFQRIFFRSWPVFCLPHGPLSRWLVKRALWRLRR